MSALKHKRQAEHALQPRPEPGMAATVYSGEIWVGVHFSDICLAAHQAERNQPFAVLQTLQGKPRVYAMNERAQQQGIDTGILSSAAYALCQGLGTVIRDEAAEYKQLQAYAQRLLRFTPRVTLSAPDTVLLEVRASLQLFGGLKGLHRQLEACLMEPHTLACAPVADAAELMARNGIGKVIRNAQQLRSALGQIDITDTSLEGKLVQRLARCGLHSLRDIWRLPRPDLARRFGPGLVHYLDQLSAQRHAPRRVFSAPEVFKARYDFEQETTDYQYLLYAAESLLQQACSYLQARILLGEKISFYLFYTRQQAVIQDELVLNVYAQQGGDSPEHFLPQLREKLHNQQLECPLIGLELRIDQFRPRTDSAYDLFKKVHRSSENWSVLLGLLFARIGRERVYRLSLCADFRPEKAWQKYPAHNLAADQRAAGKKAAGKLLGPHPSQRPTWLFKQAAHIGGAGGRSRRFRLISNAERLESGWWEDQDQRREYYQGITSTGRRCWLYRDLQATDEQWYLHGLFA